MPSLEGRHSRLPDERRCGVSEEDIAYYRQRMRSELDRAGRASHPKVAQAHLALAVLYSDRIGDPRPKAGAARLLRARVAAARLVH
jgi:hypothetical protein